MDNKKNIVALDVSLKYAQEIVWWCSKVLILLCSSPQIDNFY